MCTLSYWRIYGEKQWIDNKVCPNCGRTILNKDHGCCETGFFYCSDECARIHTNKVYNEGKYNE